MDDRKLFGKLDRESKRHQCPVEKRPRNKFTMEGKGVSAVQGKIRWE